MAAKDDTGYRTVTVEEFVRAMELNGYRKAKGSLVRISSLGNIQSACAAGQAALNLGLDPDALPHYLSGLPDVETNTEYPQGFYPYIYTRNDTQRGMTPAKIAASLKDYVKKYGKRKIRAPKLQNFPKNYQGVKV